MWPAIGHLKSCSILIVGENPGDTSSAYFYREPDSYENDPVAVRRLLLRGLHHHGFIKESTLEGFRNAGFLFDHAVRCQLPAQTIAKERQKALSYQSIRVKDPAHLRPLLSKARLVWVMGHLASNAVANATEEFAKDRRKISTAPFPGPMEKHSRFFISEYLTWRKEGKAIQICGDFADFATACQLNA